MDDAINNSSDGLKNPSRVVVVDLGKPAPWRVSREASDEVLGVCEELNLTMSGYTVEDLLYNISDVMDSLVEGLLRDGEFEDYLKEVGWEGHYAVPDVRVSDLGKILFQVPTICSTRRANDAELDAEFERLGMPVDYDGFTASFLSGEKFADEMSAEGA